MFVEQNYMIASGGGLRLGVYDNTTETFTSSVDPDGKKLSSGLDHGKFGALDCKIPDLRLRVRLDPTCQT